MRLTLLVLAAIVLGGCGMGRSAAGVAGTFDDLGCASASLKVEGACEDARQAD